jgi:hypothetical protein
MSSNRKRASQRKAIAERDHLRSEIGFGQFQNHALSLMIEKFNEQTKNLANWQDKAAEFASEVITITSRVGSSFPPTAEEWTEIAREAQSLLDLKISPKTVDLRDARANPAEPGKPQVLPVKID